MSKINVDTTKLAADLESISNDLSAMNRSVCVLNKSYNSVSESWEGRAANSFELQFVNNVKKITDIYHSLKADNDSLVEICDSYYECEQEVIAKIQAMGW